MNSILYSLFNIFISRANVSGSQETYTILFGLTLNNELINLISCKETIDSIIKINISNYSNIGELKENIGKKLEKFSIVKDDNYKSTAELKKILEDLQNKGDAIVNKIQGFIDMSKQ